MYEAHFGLKSRPFGSKAEGAGVFTGPRQVEVMSSLKKGLAAQDAVVTVTGPVGVGKTTIVSRALETISPGRMVAWVSRMQLAPDEVVELLLAGFGIKRQGKGTIQRFAAFRRLMAEQAAVGAQVAIVVEDALRIGAEALVEIEALTAADTGDGTSANIILMGPPELHRIMSSPDLARMKQRNRLRQDVDALTLPEVQGYLKHCIRTAGGDFDAIFGPGIPDIVFGCSEGIPRVINTLCESALTAAMEDGLSRIPAMLMHKVAVDAFGYDGPLPDVPDVEDVPEIPAAAEPSAVAEEPTPVAKAPGDTGTDTPNTGDADIDWEPPGAATKPDVESMDESELPPAARNIVVESGRYPEVPETPEAAPVPVADPTPDANPPSANDAMATQEDVETPDLPQTDAKAAATTPEPDDDFEIPELIEDTQPELSKLTLPDPEPEANDPSYDKSGSTEIQQKPEGIEAVAAAAAAARNATAEPPGDENFDLDAALSFETESTNVMEGITPNLDELAAKAADAEFAGEAALTTAQPAAPAPQATPSLDDLPTLSDSMRVDVDEEVDKAKQAMAANQAESDDPAPAPAPPKPAAPEAAVAKKAAASATDDGPGDTKAGSPVAAESATVEKAAPAAKPEPATPKTADETVATMPASATEPATDESAPEVMTLEPDLELLGENLPDEAATAPAAPKAELPPGMDAANMDAGAAAKPQPVAKVSEMTARIAALDPASRENDVDALEAALHAAKKGELDQMLEATANPQDSQAEIADAVTPDAIELTLDDALANQQEQNAELDKFADEIRQANSLEEFSDAMAETLFGDENFDAIAAAVTANPPDAYQAEGTPAGAEAEESDAPEAEPLLSLETPDEPAPAANGQSAPDGELRQSQVMRMDVLNALNDDPAAEATEEVEMSTGTYQALPSGPNDSQPESIENQINTSMTQTLEALNVAKAADEVAANSEDKKEKKSGGFFSRFRRSS
jgi:type II secretory pathway predicted ATPase ExeA